MVATLLVELVVLALLLRLGWLVLPALLDQAGAFVGNCRVTPQL